MDKQDIFVGVDLGGTKIRSVALDRWRNVVSEDERKSGIGAQDVTQNLLDSIGTVLSQLPEDEYELSHIGIGTPGTVDPVAKIVRHSLNLGISELDLGEAVQSRFNCELNLENDVNATALGLSTIYQELTSLAYLNFGTGLAAGFVINGKIWSGASGLAGEIGHIPIGSEEASCQCGQVGCLEVLTTWTGLGLKYPNLKDFSEVLKSGDKIAEATQAFAIFRLNAVRALLTLFLSIDPEQIFVGGGMMQNNKSVFEQVLADFGKFVESSPLLSGKNLEKRVQMIPDNSPVACIGAVGEI